MSKPRFLPITLLVLSAFGVTSQASASLTLETYSSGDPTLETIGGYAMTDFAFTYSNPSPDTNSVVSPLGGALNFLDESENSLDMTHSSANNNTSWWKNGEAGDYDIYTTHVSLVTLILPEDTRAFSFNVGAHLFSNGPNAWLTAIESDGLGIDNEHWFNVNKTNTPGFGIYTAGESCSSITSITIDPLLWGFGNFSINQDSCSTDVPEPSVFALFAAGLFGLGFARRKVRS